MRQMIALAALGVLLIGGGAALAGERTVTLAVDGMTCASCPYIVKRTLTGVPGVSDVAVSFETKTAVVTFDDARTGLTALTEATAGVGFPSRLLLQGG